MAMYAFVPLTADGGPENDVTGAKPLGRPARPMLRAVARMAAGVPAQPFPAGESDVEEADDKAGDEK